MGKKFIFRIANGDVLHVEVDRLSGSGSDESGYPTNTIVTYVCNDGFKLLAKGVDRIFCLPNGVWSGHRVHQTTKNLPKCVEIECTIPNNFHNGQILLQVSTFFRASHRPLFFRCARLVIGRGDQQLSPPGYQFPVKKSSLCGNERQEGLAGGRRVVREEGKNFLKS